MTTLYSDDRLPMVGELSDNMRNYDRDRLLLFDEKNVFDSLIKEEMFPFYSNSFMVVVGEKPVLEYCRYSNDRALATGIKTEILKKEGKKVVRKCAMSSHSADHIRHIYSSYEKLKDRYANSKLEINYCELFEGELPYVELEYIEGKTLAQIMDEKLKAEKVEDFQNLFREYVERISYGENVPVADYDMIFANIIIHQDRWIVIDYEWTKEERVETKEIAFRSLYCYLMENEKRNKLDMSFAFELLDLKQEEQEEFREKEIKFQKQVLGKRRSMSELRGLIGEKIFQPIRWMENLSKEEGKDRVQIYLDRGNGYQEEDSFFIPDAYISEEEIELKISVESNVKAVRIDPAMESCIVKIQEFTFNGERIPFQNKKAMITNGRIAGNTLVFSTQDPNMDLRLENFNKKTSNIIWLKIKIKRMSSEICEDIEKELRRKIRL